VDAPGGGGKISLQPNYIISQSAEKVVLRNFEGVITSYPEPEKYTPGRADDYFNEIYATEEVKDSTIGIAGLMNDTHSTLVPQNLNRLERRKKYEENPEHTSLKNFREKRDELKEKKHKAMLAKIEKNREEPKKNE
jgi:lysine 2,3-aminomutase